MVQRRRGPAASRGIMLRKDLDRRNLDPGTWTRDKDSVKACFDLSKGMSQIATG
jgi:hypothetical protein